MSSQLSSFTSFQQVLYSSKETKIAGKSLQAQRSSMADFSSHHSLLLKMPAALTNNGQSPNLPAGLLFYSKSHGGQAAPASANEASRGGAAMAEDASLESSSAVVDDSPQGSASPMDRKRKATEDSATLSSGHSKDCKEAKSKRGKRSSKEAEEKSTTEDEAHKGYIHVRARRGQATDSHSLAERVRRERISERMRMLQALVPGCDKVTGKALILDEIINYVQSLQNQVEVWADLSIDFVSFAFFDYLEMVVVLFALAMIPSSDLFCTMGTACFLPKCLPRQELDPTIGWFLVPLNEIVRKKSDEMRKAERAGTELQLDKSGNKSGRMQC
ncbi:hypothetical protein PR202_ga21612 [Eleusine coracana subsp. coracana]|uniref:BHLH domain-containing protein n=1 Tax=Eleusine coracana subsp. coracana TaxID=191504 RepID=A0AAV5CZJ1_ELECO|nr:hypothetical protein PR202_ga21612 [Eleusine coracana subsp. coracana]